MGRGDLGSRWIEIGTGGMARKRLESVAAGNRGSRPLVPPSHLWEGGQGVRLRITGNQRVAGEKLELAKKFRREMTAHERMLWRALRTNQLGDLHFRRQQVVAGY